MRSVVEKQVRLIFQIVFTFLSDQSARCCQGRGQLDTKCTYFIYIPSFVHDNGVYFRRISNASNILKIFG